MQVGAHHAVDVLRARVRLGLQVGAQADLVVIAALVGVVVRMHRLVDVADEVDEELERVAARRQRLAAVGEDPALRLDRADHAFAIGAVALGEVAAGAWRRVDVVPARGGLEARRIAVAQGVGPGGDAGQGRRGFAGQQHGDLGAGGGVQVALRQFADQAVAERAPGHGGGGEQQQRNGQQEAAHGGPGSSWRGSGLK
jgi:hypothetical protein